MHTCKSTPTHICNSYLKTQSNINSEIKSSFLKVICSPNNGVDAKLHFIHIKKFAVLCLSVRCTGCFFGDGEVCKLIVNTHAVG